MAGKVERIDTAAVLSLVPSTSSLPGLEEPNLEQQLRTPDWREAGGYHSNSTWIQQSGQS